MKISEAPPHTVLSCLLLRVAFMPYDVRSVSSINCSELKLRCTKHEFEHILKRACMRACIRC
jgi:hypothetical protein